MPTAIQLIKTYGGSPLKGMPSTAQLIAQWVKEKQFSIAAVNELASSPSSAFGILMQNYCMSATGVNHELFHVLNNCGRTLQRVRVRERVTPYLGYHLQNKEIGKAISESGRISPFRYGAGSSTGFSPSSNPDLPAKVLSTRIAIIGNGAAGVIMFYVLRTMGFNQIYIFEKKDSLGIWSRENVYQRSRNNPAVLNLYGNKLDAAPGGGGEVKQFLAKLASAAGNRPIAAGIQHVTPGYNFNHFLKTQTPVPEGISDEYSFPIVINCTGLGKPKSPQAAVSAKMTTNVTTTEAGERWQRELTPQTTRQHFTFIGLGNSTAEMLRQVHELQDRGADIDYKILTHYPLNSVSDPEDVVELGREKYRMFRDTSKPNLTSFQGDLPESRYDYFRALRNGKIESNVKDWGRKGEYIKIRTGRDSHSSFKTDRLFTLIGYRQDPEQLHAFGIETDVTGTAKLDYDGEVQSSRGSHRSYRGYFAFGAITENHENRNGIVIPGMLARLPDITTSIVLRATEAAQLT